jgi:DNA-binding transcriptional MerR regulator
VQYNGEKVHELSHERFQEMRITEMSRATGASADEIRYMERKGFLDSAVTRLRRRKVRNYQEADIRKVKLIIKYRRQGFTWDMAFKKAMLDLQNPPLFEDF